MTRYCQSCEICQKIEGPAPLGEMPSVDVLRQHINMDLMREITPLTSRELSWILTVIGHTTKYPEMFPLISISTTTLANTLFLIFSRMGFSEDILLDRGAQFASDIWSDMNELLQVKCLLTISPPPQMQ